MTPHATAPAVPRPTTGGATRPPTILALNGSERADGNTAAVLGHVAELAAGRGARLEVVHLAQHTILPCGTCGDCNLKRTACDVTDDVPGIVARMTAADGIIYAAPVHGFGMAETMQRFIERAGVGHLRFRRPLTNKVAGVIVTGRRYAHGDVHAQLQNNVLLNRMLLVGSGFPALVQAGARGDWRHDREGMDTVFRLTHRMIDMIELLRDYRRTTGRDLPVPHQNERALR
ncbi:flavodoxin family protein [Spirilliplanes yamanashiensis]|uniref:FMN reductase n=1 Tax=Spirilliplanes yamanashiensis TaxID=42233 RepID=A0A8J4DH76_9ACTN|nr:flavodoxin family protein [Spirilliplanes yamanashiensis]MDP9819290.1 multimeric flavodoxin WrbA [Spirilliplanes yamanashiensis]GIJ01887.1 FMN reductase [Spirilliplanes yamanashiensis]